MANPNRPKTKIICTIGPASCEVEQLRSLIQAGMGVARLNFSHGDEATHREWIRRLREAADSEEFPLCIMQDLSGPKVRIGYFQGGKAFLQPGAAFTLTTRDVMGSQQEVNVPLPDLVGMASRTKRLMLSDGTIELKVTEASGTDVHCEVVVGGFLSDRKGISFPGLPLPIDPLTAKDRSDLLIGIDEGVDLRRQAAPRARDRALSERPLRGSPRRLPPHPVRARPRVRVSPRPLPSKRIR